MINATKLTFGFSSAPLFENISFTLEDNCHCALIGSNGAGKTTLANIIKEPENYIYDGKLETVKYVLRIIMSTWCSTVLGMIRS